MTVMSRDAQPSGREPDQERAAILPVRSRDETDIGWGERAEADDDDRLLRDRPPHWDSA